MNSKIIEYYVIEESRKKQEKTCPTFLEVYYMWRSIKDLELDDNSILTANVSLLVQTLLRCLLIRLMRTQ